MIIQPCDWVETDDKYKYVVDVFGRDSNGEVARLRITGFKPYFYIKNTAPVYTILPAIEKSCGKMMFGTLITPESKLDAMNGFTGLQEIPVYKITCQSLWTFKSCTKAVKELGWVTYESDLPPFLRLFHQTEILPASSIEFESDDFEVLEDENTDVFYTCHYSAVTPSNKILPLLVCAYDIETYSASGNFPSAANSTDEIMQIGLSFRKSLDLLTNIQRLVLVSGPCDPSTDPSVNFISFKGERELLAGFKKIIQDRNPDVICGYNTYGFDDGYVADRMGRHGLNIDFGRLNYTPWKKDATSRKTFELASGKFAVRYLDMPGRLSIDLLISARREHNLDSYKLDNVASTFLRDKVVSFENNRIQTKSTRGLFVGNLVCFDIVTNTSNPYRDGKKFKVVSLTSKEFTVESDGELFQDLGKDEISKLEWCFGKDDISVPQMFASHHGTSEQRSIVAKYCIQDCDLVLTLMAKLDTLTNACGMADVCRVPIQYVFLRGQGIRIYSAVVYNASKRNQIIVTQESSNEDVSYEGAIVLPPKIGMYLDQPIPVLDFNSLYPSNMIAFNLSPDTLVYVKTYDKSGKKISHKGLDPVPPEFVVDEISYDIMEGRCICGFVQPGTNPRTVGVLPLTLDILLKKRKETRKLLETTQDDSQRSVLNGLQLAYKLVANSVYGQAGSRTSAIRKTEVAACTTALGRARIHEAKTVVENEYGATVIYGDSVTSYTPVLVRINGIVKIINIEELGNNWISYAGEKECCELTGIESWTENGWTNIERVIRHSLHHSKKIIRVVTHTGIVDVTDDHSLLKLDGSEISPKHLNIGDSLLHSSYPPIETIYKDEVLIDKAKIAGFFFGDGSCGNYNCPSGRKSSWALNNTNLELLLAYKNLCEKVYPNLDWVINNTLISSSVYKLVPKGRLVHFIDDYRNMMYIQNRKNIPDWVLNGSDKIRQAFWDGLYDADGDKDLNGYIRIDQKHQTTCAQISLLGSLLGFNISLNDRKTKLKICRMTFTKSAQRKSPTAIKKMYEVDYSGYVYDLTTSNHHFQAGIGKLIVHNTDSIFVRFPTKDLRESIDLAKQAADKITSLCRKPYKIEYEKTFFPFLLFCRKRYVGLMYEDDVTKCKRKVMGVALKRRDNAPIVKDIFGGALDILLGHRDIRLAQSFVKSELEKVLKNEVPLDKFIVTKQLRDDYKNPGSIAHRVLADRMGERDPGNAPAVGERLAYIYVEKLRDGKKQGDRIEHVDYVREKKLKPDLEFYITNQIQNPVAQLFALAIEDLDGYTPRTYATKQDLDEEESTLYTLKQKEQDLETILFMGAPYLKKLKRGPMDLFLGRK